MKGAWSRSSCMPTTITLFVRVCEKPFITGHGSCRAFKSTILIPPLAGDRPYTHAAHHRHLPSLLLPCSSPKIAKQRTKTEEKTEEKNRGDGILLGAFPPSSSGGVVETLCLTFGTEPLLSPTSPSKGSATLPACGWFRPASLCMPVCGMVGCILCESLGVCPSKQRQLGS